jgi:oligoendopeptidase F
MQELEQINQEMDDLRQRMENALGVLDSLTEIQNQFVDLAKTYRSIQSWLKLNQSNAMPLPQLQQAIEQRLDTFEQDLKQLKLRGLHPDGESLEPFLRSHTIELESRLREDLKNALERMNRLSLSSLSEEKIDRLESQIVHQRTAIQDLSQKVKKINDWTIAALTIAILSLSIPIISSFLGTAPIDEPKTESGSEIK